MAEAAAKKQVKVLNTTFTLYDIVLVGVMAALCFAVTMFIKIGPIPTPAGNTQIKLGNAFCLMAGLLLGGVRGGLAAGLGSMLFDLTDPRFVASAPTTLINFFIMACVCGLIAHWGEANGKSVPRNIVAAVAGGLTYYCLHIGKSILTLVLSGSDFTAAVAACSTKFITSGINAVIGIVVSVPLALAVRKALEKQGFTATLRKTK